MRCVLILLLLSFSLGRESENEIRVRRNTVTVFAAKCQRTTGFRAYERGDVRLCIYYGGIKKTYYDADNHCKIHGSRLALLDKPIKIQMLSSFRNAWIRFLADETRCYCMYCEPVVTLEMCRKIPKVYLCQKNIIV